ncbi:hypothetical protein [Plantactinospora sonchi]|uniref:Uncharacterized protein n=1 Tax=Plantactinospora sonchi TaxID=1544735 RepID=A0ABU7RYE9_9ACTN
MLAGDPHRRQVGERVRAATARLRRTDTRRYHPGAHAIELQVNGVGSGRTEFTLLPGVDAVPGGR